MYKFIYIFGIVLFYDGFICLMKDGEIIFVIEKERILRIKYDGFNDNVII